MTANLFKRMKNWKKFLFSKSFVNFALFFICLMFSLKNLFANIAEYRNDEGYIITPTYVSPSEIDLPTISICLTSYIDEAKVRKFHPGKFDLEALRNMKMDDRMDIYAAKLKINEIQNVSYYFDQIFEGCELLLNNGQQELCNKENYTKIWLSLETKCYQFFHNLTYKYKPYRIKGQFWLSLRIAPKMRDGSNLGFLLTSPNKTIEPFLSNPSYFPITTSVLYTIMLTYTKETIYKLEKPFNTKCKNYSFPFMDQLNCSNACVVKKLSKSNNSFWPSNLPTDDLDSEMYFKKIEDYHILYKDCLQTECAQQDCISARYLIYNKYEKFGYNTDKVKFTIRLIYNFAPETLIRYQPRISSEFSSILSFISAPISFWLGLAFFHLFNYLVNFAEFFYQIFKRYSPSSRS